MDNHSQQIVAKLWNYCNVLPDPDVIAEEIVEDLQAALDQFAAISADLQSGRD